MNPILGLHHITIGANDAQRTIDFYTGLLGLRFVKKTVNFDDPTSYHLYFGDETGSPGTAITFFEWPTAPRGAPGIGGTHHLALRVADHNGLLQWKRRLSDAGLKVAGPYDRHYFQSIYFRDLDGLILEIATDGPGMLVDETPETLGQTRLAPPEAMLAANRDEADIDALTWSEPVPSVTAEISLLKGMHHISAMSSDIQRTDAFLSEVLGLRRVKMTGNFDNPDSAHWYWGVGAGQPGSLITYFEYDAETMGRAQMGVGQTHHFAFRVADEDTQLAYRERLIQHGYRVSPVMDRVYFRSIYSSDPDGHIVEIATDTPGFTVDERLAELGQNLRLPPWLEEQRAEIEQGLRPVTVPEWEPPT
jgi:glyoxalase family protein